MKRKDYRKMIETRAKQKKRAKMLVCGTMLAAPLLMTLPNGIVANAEIAAYGANVEAEGYVVLDDITIPIPAGGTVTFTGGTGNRQIVINGQNYSLEAAKVIEINNASITGTARLNYLDNAETIKVTNCTFADKVDFSYNTKLTTLEVSGCEFNRIVDIVGNTNLSAANFDDCDFVNRDSRTEYAVHANSNKKGFDLYLNECRYAGSNIPGNNSTIHNIQGTTHFSQDETPTDVGPSAFVEKGIITVDGVDYNVFGKKIWSSFSGNKLIVRENNSVGTVLISVDAPQSIVYDGVRGNLVDVNGLESLTSLVIKDSYFDNYLAAGSGSLVECEVSNTYFGQYIHVRWNPGLSNIVVDHVFTGQYITINDNGYEDTSISISNTYASSYIDLAMGKGKFALKNTSTNSYLVYNHNGDSNVIDIPDGDADADADAESDADADQ